MTSTNNPFHNLFADKDLQATERSLRAHKGVLTKLTCYIDTAVNAVHVLPTAKGCTELEQLKEKMEYKIEEMEAGYDRLIELDPGNEKRYLEKKREVVDIAVSSHAQLLPAIAHCQDCLLYTSPSPRDLSTSRMPSSA